MDNIPSIDPKNISTWIIASICLGILALMVGVYAVNQLYQATVMTQNEVLILNKKIEDVRKLAEGGAARTPSSAPAQPTGQPAK